MLLLLDILSFVIGALIGGFSSAVGYRVFTNYTSQYPFGQNGTTGPGTNAAIGVGVWWAIVNMAITQSLGQPYRLVGAFLTAPTAMLVVLSLIFIGFKTHQFFIRMRVNPGSLVNTVADRICPPREPGRFDDENNPV